jgi:hypothetical protein
VTRLKKETEENGKSGSLLSSDTDEKRMENFTSLKLIRKIVHELFSLSCEGRGREAFDERTVNTNAGKQCRKRLPEIDAGNFSSPSTATLI